MLRPSVFFIGNFLSSEGRNQTMVEQLANRFDRAGYTVVAASSYSPRIRRLLDMMLTAWIHREEYRVAYLDVYSGAAFRWAEVMSALLGLMQKPYVLALRGGNLPAFALRWPRRVGRLLSCAAAVVSPSGYLQTELQAYRRDIRVIPNPLEVSQYQHARPDTTIAELMWLRAFHQNYNPSLAVRVLAELKRMGIYATLTMVGPDKGDGSLEVMLQLADALQVTPQVQVVRGVPKEEVPLQLSHGRIFINTTNVDNTPVSVIEAMACGLCVVSTNVGGIPYLLADEKNALLVPPDNHVEMARAISRILNDPELEWRLSTNARRKAGEFDWSIVLPLWEALFQEVLNA